MIGNKYFIENETNKKYTFVSIRFQTLMLLLVMTILFYEILFSASNENKERKKDIDHYLQKI